MQDQTVDEFVRNVKQKKLVSASESKSQFPSFVLPLGQHVDSDVDEDSDAEEFNSVDDLFEVTDQDRKRQPLLPFPEGFEHLPISEKAKWMHQYYLKKLKEEQESECVKRKVLYKLMYRLQNRTHIEQTFYSMIRRVCPHLVCIQNRNAEDSLQLTLRTLSLSPCVFDKYNFLKLCALYGIYNMSGKRELAFTKEQLMSLAGKLSSNAFVAGYEKLRHHQENVEADFEFFQKEMTSLCDKYVKFSLVVSLPFMLTNELTFIMKQVIEVKRVLSRRNLNLPLVDNKVLEYLVPNYLAYPVRGPFKPNYYGTSETFSMYGSKPNPNFFYCECSLKQQVCGHRGLFLKSVTTRRSSF